MRSSSGSRSRDRHGWQRRDSYFNTHLSHMERLAREGFLLEDRLRVNQSDTLITIQVSLICDHELRIDVAKTLARREERVRTFKYSYHAAFSDPHRGIFRYDDAHIHPGHLDRHHRHVFEPVGAPEPGTVEWVGHDR